MIDYKNIRDTVCQGIKEKLGLTIIRSSQNQVSPPYPYCSYTVTSVMSANNGTYSIVKSNNTTTAYKEVTQIWSITVMSDKYEECVEKAMKLRNFLDFSGRDYLKDNNVIVQQITGITNRDNMISIDYEYRQGFDVVFSGLDVIEDGREYIEDIEIKGETELPESDNKFGLSDVIVEIERRDLDAKR